MATIKQIAEMAGVSRGTVDRVLNNRGSVNANTAARVREIAEKLNYKPNKAGLMLAAQKKKSENRCYFIFPIPILFSVKSLKRKCQSKRIICL